MKKLFIIFLFIILSIIILFIIFSNSLSKIEDDVDKKKKANQKIGLRIDDKDYDYGDSRIKDYDEDDRIKIKSYDEDKRKIENRNIEKGGGKAEEILRIVDSRKKKLIPEVLDFVKDGKNGEAIVDVIENIMNNTDEDYKKEASKQAIELLKGNNIVAENNILMHLISRVGGEDALELLKKKTEHNNEEIKFLAYHNLGNFDFKKIKDKTVKSLFSKLLQDLKKTNDEELRNNIFNKMNGISESGKLSGNMLGIIPKLLSAELKLRWARRGQLDYSVIYLINELAFFYKTHARLLDMASELEPYFSNDPLIWGYIEEVVSGKL
ncbi:MAG: hypothetical protein ABIA04_08320 [Pseudomonadota bacterium]